MSTAEQRRAALNQVLELVIVLGEDMTRSLARKGLTDARAHLLWEVAARGPSTQRSLADALRVSPRNITGLVDGLIATGFVSRRPHPTDRRASLVELTDHGVATTQGLQDEQRKLSDLLFGEFTEEQLACFTRGLGHVLATLRSATEPSA